MSEPLTREQVEMKLACLLNGESFNIERLRANEQLIAHDAALRQELESQRQQVIAGVYDAASVGITLIQTHILDKLRQELAEAQKRYEDQCTGTMTRLQRIQTLEQQLALSMARQETLASNVNDGLLEHRALREQLAQAEEEIAFWKLQAVDR